MASAVTDAAVARPRRKPKALRRAAEYWPSWVAGLTLIVLIVRMAWDQGGYFADTYLEAGEIAFAVLGVLLLVRTPRFAVSARALIALAALAAFTGWTALSATWSLSAHGAINAMERDLVYTGLFALALLAAGSGRYVRLLVWGALGVIVAIVGGALLSRLYPDVVPSTLPQIGRVAVYRLSYPLGYWNSLGGLGAMGTILAIGLAADVRTAVPLRALSAGAAVMLATTTYLTLSRGAAFALLVGLVVLVLLTVRHGSLVLTFTVIGAGIALSIARLQSYNQLTDNPALRPGQLAAGHAFGRELILIVAAVVALNLVVALGRASDAVMGVVALGRKPLLVGAAVLALCAAGLGIARAGDVGHGLDSAGSYVSRQWSNFWNPTNNVVAPLGLARFSSVAGTRGDLYSAAFDGFKASPLTGDGAGSFPVRWLRQRPDYEVVRNAHSLEIETLGEEGLIGAALLALFIGTVLFSALRARVSPLGLGRAQGATVSAACVVWLVHSAFDWDWQMTAMTAIALVLASTLFPARAAERGAR